MRGDIASPVAGAGHMSAELFEAAQRSSSNYSLGRPTHRGTGALVPHQFSRHT